MRTSLALLLPLLATASHAAGFYAVDLKAGEDARAVVAKTPGAARWLGLGDTLVVEAAVAPAGHSARPLECSASSGFALILSKHHPLDAAHIPVAGTLLARHAGVALAAVQPGPLPASSENHLEVRNVPWNTVLIEPARPRASKSAVQPEIDAMVGSVSAAAIQKDIQKLTDFKTRNTLSEGYREAASWAEGEFKALGLKTSRVPFQISGRTAENVMAEMAGPAGSTDVYVIGAHLDSIAFDGGSTSAPGADDNASGSACVIAIARAFAGKKPNATLRFMLYGGEEEDLLGSTQYVASLSAEEKARIKGAFILDMTAFHRGAQRGLMLEGRAISRPLTDAVATAAARYTQLKVESTLEAWGSDHIPFLDEGIPALLTFELDYPENGNQHSLKDTMDIVDAEQAAMIARADVAALASLTGLAAPANLASR